MTPFSRSQSALELVQKSVLPTSSMVYDLNKHINYTYPLNFWDPFCFHFSEASDAPCPGAGRGAGGPEEDREQVAHSGEVDEYFFFGGYFLFFWGGWVGWGGLQFFRCVYFWRGRRFWNLLRRMDIKE